MYDEDIDGEITAYSFELNQGYVVVAAYLDAPNTILEWSDTASPVYLDFELESRDRIVYLGNLNYYKDFGAEELESIDGYYIERENVVNSIRENSSINFVPTSVIQSIISSKSDANILSDPEIVNPITHANQNYQGPFVSNDYVNNWENYMTFYKTSYFTNAYPGYYVSNHCGPTAITNMICSYGNRYNNSFIQSHTYLSIFYDVAILGTSNWYFSTLGTPMATAGTYIDAAFDMYNINATVYGQTIISYNNVKNALNNNRLLYTMLTNHSIYGNHAVVTYAYTRLISTTTGLYKTYLKVADGWNTSGRYIDTATASSDSFYSVSF